MFSYMSAPSVYLCCKDPEQTLDYVFLSPLLVSVHCQTHSKYAAMINTEKCAHITNVQLGQLSQIKLIPITSSQIKKENITSTVRNLSYSIPSSREANILTSNRIIFVLLKNGIIQYILSWSGLFLSLCLQKLSISFCVLLLAIHSH